MLIGSFASGCLESESAAPSSAHDDLAREEPIDEVDAAGDLDDETLEPDGATEPAPGQSAGASASVAGWTALGATNAPGAVRRVVPLSQGGYAVLVRTTNGGLAVYRWSGPGPQAVWTALPLPAPQGEVSDIAEFEGRLYASGPFSWISGQAFPIEGSPFSYGVLTEVKRLLVSIALDDPQAVWVAMKITSDADPCSGSHCSDKLPSAPLRLHVVPAGNLRGLYLLGGGISLGASDSHCGSGPGFGGGSGCGNSVLRLRPTIDAMAGGLGNVPIGDAPGGTKAIAVAHGAMALTPGAAPVPVLVVGGILHADNEGEPLAGGYGLGAWDGMKWHAVATGIERIPVQCSGGLCGLTLQQSVNGLAFVGTDLYVAGEFATVPLDASRTYDPAVDALGACATIGDTCQVLNGFAVVKDGQWRVLQDPRFALPGLAHGLGTRLVATSQGVLMLGGPWIPGKRVDAPTLDVLAPLGTHPTKNGILRWDGARWDSVQGGTHCFQSEDCSGIVHDVAVVPGRPSFVVAGEFTAVGRMGVASALSIHLAVFTPADECVADLNGDRYVGGADLGMLLSMWGATTPTKADINDDGIVNGSDLGFLQAAWGACPELLQPCGAPSACVDARDGRSYPTALVGTQCWMAANLDHGAQITATSTGSVASNDALPQKLCFGNLAANCAQHGGLYEWGEAMQFAPSDALSKGRTRGICPDGWHMPTDLEVQLLEHALGMTPSEVVATGNRGAPAGTKLKQGGDTGFDMKLSGRRVAQSGAFEGLNATGGFWTATAAASGQAWARLFANNSAAINRSATAAVNAYAVRCVRD
jgi:uncharacterized protein (TIGR02145 family)